MTTLWPAATGPQEPRPTGPWAPGEFPTRRDRALGDDHIDVTPDNCGVGDDPIAQVLYLRGLADQIEQAMTGAERAELAQYYRPGLKAVA